MTTKHTPHFSIEECIQRYMAAVDEIYYMAEQLAEHMSNPEDYENANDILDGLVCRVEDMPLDIENIRDDAVRGEA